jgi:hypothetical protein
MTVRDKGVQTFNAIRENNRDCRRTAESGHEETLSCSWEESVQVKAGDQIRNTVARTTVTDNGGGGVLTNRAVGVAILMWLSKEKRQTAAEKTSAEGAIRRVVVEQFRTTSDPLKLRM